MSEMLLVLEREFVTRVRSRSFLLSTLLVPLFMVLVFAVPILMQVTGSGGEQRIVVVDEGPPAVGEQVVRSLSAVPTRERDTRFAVEHLRVPLASVRDSLNAAIRVESVDGYLWIPPGVVEQSGAAYRARNVTDFEIQERLSAAVSEAVQAVRLAEAGLQISEVASLLRPVQVEASRITRDGEEGASAAATMIVSIAVGFLLYFLTLFYGAQVMQSVQEEKTNRISEVLVSSIRASHLMLGKVLGVGSAALLQVLIWAAIAVVMVSQRERLLDMLGLPASNLPLPSLGIDPMLGAALGLFAFFGFFLYAALFAAAGAAAASSEDAQRFTFPLIVPLLLPILMQQQIIRDPQGTLATVLGWIPLTSPIVMPMRIGAGGISTLEVVGSLVTLALGVGVLGWLAGKIYRVGILATGKRPTLRDLARWLRTA